MTSLVFMLTEVPAPPWKTSTGNWSMHRPSVSTESQPAMMASATSAGMVHISLLAMAEAFLTITMPRTISGTSLILAELILKFSMARTVCMP